MELHHEVSGSGKISLICVHGWACNGGQFMELKRFLDPKFRVFCPDLPGHGRTPLGDFSPGFDRYAGAIVEFALQHKLERPVLLGHSMGGALSLMAAATGRIQPRAVINLDGSLPAAESTLKGQRLIRSWLDEPDFRDRLAKLLREAFFLPAERDGQCDEIIRTMCSAPEAVLRFLPEQVGDLQPEQTLPKVTAPVMFIGSPAPRFDPEKAAALIPRFRLERILNAGHFLHLYGVEQVGALIQDFLTLEILR